MAVIAANSVTSNSPANAASGSSNAAATGDVFAAMLDQLDLTNGMAVTSADAVSADADASDDAAAATPSNDASAPATDPMLAQLLAAQQAATNPAPAVTAKADTDADAADDASDQHPTTDDHADTTVAAASRDATNLVVTPPQASAPTNTPDAPSKAAADAASRPMTPDSDASAKPTRDAHRSRGDRTHDRGVDATAGDDTSAAAATNTDTSATQTANTDAKPDAPVQVRVAAPVDAVAVETVTASATTDQAASAIVPKGTTAKPGKAASGVASNDGSTSEGRSTKASALADAGDVAKRGFASEPAVRAATLHVPNKADDTADAATRPATPQQHNPANPTTIATPAQPDAAPVQQAEAPAAPVHAAQQPAPQVDPGVSIATINTGASPTQTAATPAHLAAQIQVTQHAPNVDSLAVTIAAKSQDGQKHFDIRLDPAELGRVDVRLTVDDAGKAQAVLTVEKPQTLELLQKDQSHLERALKDAGLDLTQNGLSFSLKGQQQQQQNAQDHTPFARGQRLAARAAAAVQDITPTLSTSGLAGSDTRLDIRV